MVKHIKIFNIRISSAPQNAINSNDTVAFDNSVVDERRTAMAVYLRHVKRELCKWIGGNYIDEWFLIRHKANPPNAIVTGVYVADNNNNIGKLY